VFRLICALAIMTAALVAPASAQFGSNNPMVDARMIAERQSAAPGETFYIALRQEITPGWHTYWRNPGDSGEPSRIDASLPEGWTTGGMVWPAPNTYSLGPLTNYGYSNAVTLPVPLTVPEDAAPGRVDIPVHATWLVCEDICIPEEARLTLSLEIGENRADPEGQALIAEALMAAPVPSGLEGGVVRSEDGLTITLAGGALAGGADAIRDFHFFPYETGMIDHSAPQAVALAPDSARIDVRNGYLTRSGVDQTYGGVIVFETRGEDGGWSRRQLVVELEPGASVNALAAAGASSPGGGQGGSAIQGLTFMQAALFALLGGLILNLMPCVFPVLSIKALSIVEKRGSERAEARTLGLIFAAGVIGTFLALGGLLLILRFAGLPDLWGVQLQVPAVVAGLALLMFLIGLNFIGVFEIGSSLQGVGSGVRDNSRRGAFLTGVLAVFVAAPCLAPFMTGALTFALSQPPIVSMMVFAFLGVGLAAPFVLVSFYPEALAFLPKPGPWMVRFKQVLAFPMFATAIWLVWVLTAQVGANGALWILLGFLAAGFAVWAFSLRGGISRVAGIAGVLLTAGAMVSIARLDTAPASAPTEANWAAWSPEIVQQMRAEGRPVFVDFTAAWCVTCQVNKMGALSERQVRNAFEANNVALFRADFTNRDPVIANELNSHGAAGVPLYLVYPAGGGAPETLPPLLTGSIVIEAVGRAAN